VAALGRNGDLSVLDLGGSVRVMDLAREFVCPVERVRETGVSAASAADDYAFDRDHVLRPRPALSGTRIGTLTASST